MGRRRLVRAAFSDDEDEEEVPPKRPRSGGPSAESPRPAAEVEDDLDEVETNFGRGKRRGLSAKRSQAILDDSEDTKEEEVKMKVPEAPGAAGDGEKEEHEEEETLRPVGEVIKVSGKGRGRKQHYGSFEFEGNVFDIEDAVLITPEDTTQKPYVAIIKDIVIAKGKLCVQGQWFYRPEEAERKGGGNWQPRDTRELFYSFHVDDIPPESVMHKCIVHFVPLHKQLPNRKEHPGFIVQKVYDVNEKKLFKLTDKDYEDSKQHEIDVLVQKTRQRIGELPDLELEDTGTENADQQVVKRNLRRTTLNPLVVTKGDDLLGRSDGFSKVDTPGSCQNEVLKYHTVLSRFKAFTSDSHRNRWLDKLLQAVKVACDTKEGTLAGNTYRNSDATTANIKEANEAITIDEFSDGWGKCYSPEGVVSVIAALEQATFEALGSDVKYNQKMRQLEFNLKTNPILAKRLLSKELDAPVLLTMTPIELKTGLTAEEKAASEPEESKNLQMTDARCTRCSEKKVGIAEIIHAGGHGHRYQLECIGCGNTWYSSQDSITALTIDAPNAAINVGTAPWATAKFEDVEKNLVSPRDAPPEKLAADFPGKGNAAHTPALDTQKSFGRSRADNDSAPAADGLK